MKNKIGKGVLVCLCLFMMYSSSARADDAFVVEEEAVIGTQESVTESLPVVPVQQPVAVKEESKEQKPVAVKEESKEQKTVRKEEEKQEETISQNTPVPAFQVPARRQQTKVEEEPGQEAQQETPSEAVAEEQQEDMPRPRQKEVSWWFPVISGFFLLFGIVRIVHRLLIRGGKL